jgi:hypothetical protein
MTAERQAVPRGGRVRGAAACLLIGAYLAATAVFLALHLVGDFIHPIAYFFTWDMFPGHYSLSLRRVAVGETASGRQLQLYPTTDRAYRGGVHGDLGRADLDRSGYLIHPVALAAAARYNEETPDDKIVRVRLFERYWPAKFNYSPRAYERWAGSPHPQRRYWRLIGEFAVDDHAARARPGAQEESP